MYYVLDWLGPLGGFLFRRGMYKKYYEPKNDGSRVPDPRSSVSPSTP